jgi:hypothetical protein
MVTKTQTKPVTKPVVANPVSAQVPASTPATAPVAAPAADKPKAEKKQRTSKEKFTAAQVITFNPDVYKGKPKRGKSATRFNAFIAAYKPGMTVQQYVDLWKANGWNSTLAYADLHWDAHRNFISVA